MPGAPYEAYRTEAFREDGAYRSSYTAAERAADRVVHVAGIAFAALGAPIILLFAVWSHGMSSVTLSAGVYAASLVAMICCSAAYHMNEAPENCDWLRRTDHAAIFLKIAGTYTPLAILHGAEMTSQILLMLWGAALMGMGFKIALPRRGDRAALLLYFAMGWSAVVLGTPILENMTPDGFWLAIGGGILYTAGIVFFLWESLPYQNAIWHAMVLAATTLVFAAILVELAASAQF